MIATVNNVTPGKSKFVVARDVEGEFWYFGRWDGYGDALNVAQDIGNGVVLIDEKSKLEEIFEIINMTENAKKEREGDEFRTTCAEAVGYEHIKRLIENG